MNFDRRIGVDNVAYREIENDATSLITVEQRKLLEMFYRLECAVSNAHHEEVEPGNWNYIPYSHLRFYKALKEVLATANGSSFLEMGCGLGVKLYIAGHWANCRLTDGVEINPKYAEIAREMICKRGSVYCCDVRDFDKYGMYDIIYTYGEVRRFRVDQKVIERVKSQMKSGAVLIEAFLNHEPQVWRKE